MTDVLIKAGSFTFPGVFERSNAPETVHAFLGHMPFASRCVHVRWSGEGVWMPLGDLQFGVGFENATSYPAPGQVLLYPGGKSETEILIGYGAVCFASKAGQLAGNHFLTITEGLPDLYRLGRMCLWEGAQDVRIELRG